VHKLPTGSINPSPLSLMRVQVHGQHTSACEFQQVDILALQETEGLRSRPTSFSRRQLCYSTNVCQSAAALYTHNIKALKYLKEQPFIGGESYCGYCSIGICKVCTLSK
jgi:hypothetical protein